MSKILAAFEGQKGSHSYLVLQAYLNSLGLELEPVGLQNFREVATRVLCEKANIGILPVDNAIAGTIREGYDLIAEYDLVPFAEMVWRMDHRILGVEGSSLDKIKTVLAHPIVLDECRKFLGSLYGATVKPWCDTGAAAAEVQKLNDPTVVCIAPPEATELFGLVELAENVADHPQNFTRFLIFRSPNAKGVEKKLGGQCPLKDRKTSLRLQVSNEKGQLAEALKIFSDEGINLTKIESCPILGKPFEVLFYVDIEGEMNEERVSKAILRLKEHSATLKVLGSYDTFPAGNVKKQGDFSITPQPTIEEKLEDLMPASAKNWPRAARPQRPKGTVLNIGNATIGDGRFTVIAGPCSVESRDQVMVTANHVKEHGATLLRGGAFKPRTNPYAFQGLGWDGVALLAEAGRSTGLPIVSEVMSVDQVERMAREVDVLQIGARNMQNYDLLRKVGETHVPVLLKRGLSASLDELLSAAEYVLAGGNPNVMLCERGIRTFETSTRFTLDLNAVPVLKERTHLPVIIDPSHGVGVRRWIRPLCRAAKAVGADGIIIEVHPNPEEAKSDKDQALTFDDFIQIQHDLAKIADSWD